MYKLVFVDDESLVRNQISRMIEWEKSGFLLVGCCSNGYELMDLLEREPVDLVILDINMPFISGLEAARQIRHSYPYVHIVFLTGYSSFEYAKQALELKALQYIVKPISAHELHNVLDEVRVVLDKENAEVKKMAELEHSYRKNQLTFLEDLLRDVIQNTVVYERANACGLAWNAQSCFQVVVFSPDKTGMGANWEGTKSETILYALCNVVSEIAQERRLGFACVQQNTVILLGCAGDANFEFEIQEGIEYILGLVAGKLQFTATAGIGCAYRGYEGIQRSLAEAQKALSLRTKSGNNRLFTVQDLQGCASGHAAVWDAVNYIETHYSDPKLSADAVCEYLHLSPSYLRTLFKQQTGETIIGYITKARMERARTLIAENEMKNYCIAETVGYVDPHYFGYCFKRYFGITPAAMRENMQPKERM